MGHRITKVYTRTGDDGTTSLGNGRRTDKDSPRLTVIGDIDELNSLLGVLTASNLPDDMAGYLLNIQHRLFDIGAELSVPGNAVIDMTHVHRLEELIDNYNTDLKPLKEFILPGGILPAAICHLARSVCRRAERHIVKLGRSEYVNPNTLIYVNRLSDLLFVFARILNLRKRGREIYWDRQRLKRSV